MIRWIVEKSLDLRFIVCFIALIVVFLGLAGLRNMAVDVFPEFAPPLVEIQTEGPGMSAEEVESLVTVQIEEALNNMPGLDTIRSKSVPGLSSIRLLFERGSDPVLIRQLTQERLLTVMPRLLPPADAPIILPPLSSTSRLMKVGISSEEHSLMDLSMTAYWKIVLRLNQIPGVANVPIWGERLKMLTVQANPQLLGVHRVTLDELMETTSDALDFGLLGYTPAAELQAGGFIDTSDDERISIRYNTPGITPAQLADVQISGRVKSNGTPLIIDDVADVEWVHQPLIGEAVVSGGPGLLLIVEKFPWGNTLEVTRAVEEAIEEMKPGLPGMSFDTTIFRPATFIELSIKNLTKSLLIGSFLVFLAILFFLMEWRVALVSTIIIPISMITTLFVLGLLGTSINVMVLTGIIIAIGMVIDDAIVDVENITRRFRQRREEGSDEPLKKTVLEASLEVRSVIIYASFIEIAVLLPVFFLGGLSGAFFQPLASVYILAGLISPFVALTVTPALILILLSNTKPKQKESRFMIWLRESYTQILQSRALASVSMGLAGVVLVASIAIIPFLGKELLPSFKESDFLMHWLAIPGTSPDEMRRITKQAEIELLEIPGVRNFGAHIGRAIIADEVVGMYFGENWVSISPEVDYDDTLAAIQEVVHGYPGLVRDVQTYLKERIREVLTGSSNAIVARIYGPEISELRSIAKELEKNLSGVEGLIDLHTSLQLDIPHIQVEVDLEKARWYGIKPGDVRRAAATIINGVEVSDLHQDKVYEVMVWSIPEARNSVDDVRSLLIDVPRGGGQVRLDAIANVEIKPTPNLIKRENNSRRIDVEGNVGEGRTLDRVARDVEAVIEEMELPLEYHIELLGEFAERQSAVRTMAIVTFFVLIGIFFLLYFVFSSWRLALMSLVTIPTALSGGVIAILVAGGGVISLGSLVGFLTVLGVATRNSIMLISHYQHLENEEGEPFGDNLIIRGARERITPILMTAFTTAFAIIPLVIAGNIPGHEIEHPMALVILGGLITATLLNLFVMPVLYKWVRSRMPEQN